MDRVIVRSFSLSCALLRGLIASRDNVGESKYGSKVGRRAVLVSRLTWHVTPWSLGVVRVSRGFWVYTLPVDYMMTVDTGQS